MVVEKIFPRKMTSKQILPKLGQKCFPKSSRQTISLLGEISPRTYKEIFLKNNDI